VPNTTDTRFHVGSVTKQFTAALVLTLVEEDKIALDLTILLSVGAQEKTASRRDRRIR
jgi:CubicO group peptidase (beta-lactamase class C family)